MYISIRGRVWIEAEAANMVESVGYYTKHRKLPLVVKIEGKYVTFFVPAISGESVAHTYQTLLADELLKLKENVCSLCRQGKFLKSTNSEVLRETVGAELYSNIMESQKGKNENGEEQKSKKKKEEELNKALKIEEAIVASCAVEDIGGFLFADNPNVKRTSSFMTGYMVPVFEALQYSLTDPQLQSRYALGTRFVGVEEAGAVEDEERTEHSKQASGQMIYYVELSSAVYTFSFDLDTKFIGKHTYVSDDNYGKKVGALSDENVKNRKLAALESLKKLLLEFPIGAKRARFNPITSWESLAIAVSDDVWTLPSSFTEDYIDRAAKKISSYNVNTEIYAYAKGLSVSGDTVRVPDSPEDAISKAIEAAKNRISNEV